MHEARVRAVLQAGGRGQRLRPLTDTMPKPLLPVGGVPMIERLVRQLRGSGIRSIAVVTRWLGDRVEDHLRSLSDLDIELEIVHELDARGTVGGICALPPYEGTTLFLFADLVTDLDFERFYRSHVESGAALTLATHTERYRVRLGEVISDGNRVTGYLEKPEKEFTICSGIALIEPEVIALSADASGRFGMPEMVAGALAAGLDVAHWWHDSLWIDVNSPEALDDAEHALANKQAGVRADFVLTPSAHADLALGDADGAEAGWRCR